jgi:hypothetical protein
VDHARAVIDRLPWQLAHGGCLLQERVYRRVFGLRAIGELIYLGRARYRGPGKVFADLTRIEPGDPLGIIHVDNLRLAAIERQPGSPRHRAFVFIRLLRNSLALLAQRIRVDPELEDLAGFRGITWMPSRGRHLGFETEPLPSNLRTRWLKLHFRLLLYAFDREAAPHQAVNLQPHIYWLTRRQLIERHALGATSGSCETPGVH